jgi:UDP-glucuronate 4-epimerase
VRILVTGCAGFIGFHVAQGLLARDHNVIGIDSINEYYDPELKYARLSELGVGRDAGDWGRSTRSSRHPGFAFVRTRLEDKAALEALFAGNNFDRVINLAAQAGVRYSIDHPEEYVSSNIVGFLNILECCRVQKVPHLIYASSSSVYGLNRNRPFSVQDHTDHPVSLYAATKKANEMMAHSYSHLYGLPTTGLRFFTVYGPWGRPDMAYYKFAVAIRAGKSIDVYNNGDMLRDFTYIEDVVDAVLRATMLIPVPDASFDAKHPNPATSRAPYRIYNVGNNRPVRLGDFVKAIENVTGRAAVINYLPMQPGDVYATEADITETTESLSWKPETDLARGMELFIAWLDQYEKMTLTA